MGTEQKSDRRQWQRNGQHRGVGHHVHPVGVIHAVREERIDAIREHSGTVRQHPLEESLILRIITQFMIKIEPQRQSQHDREDDESADGHDVTPREQAPPPQAYDLLIHGFPGGGRGRASDHRAT
nr:hypothetical protein [Actinoplanes campanulatus]